MTRTRNWVFTFYPEIEYDITDDKIENLLIKYLGYGIEFCPKTKKKHFQGLVICNNAITFNSIKKKLSLLFNDTIHIEIMKSSFDKNLKYCEKDGDFVDYGNRPKGQGSRSDIQQIIHSCKNGDKMSKIIDNVNINYQNLKFLENINKYLEPARPIKPIKVIWLYGEAGTGKTSFVYKNFTDVYRPITEKWWSGYDGHKTVLIDDIRPSWCNFTRLLQLTDIYPFMVEVKGGSRQVAYDTIVITAPVDHKKMWASETKEDILQLSRRIVEEREITHKSIGNTTAIDSDNLTVTF